MQADQILVVDDEPDIREALQLLLHDVMGLDVVTAPNGKAGLAELAKCGENLRLIVSDFRMPGMDGLEFLAAAARQRPEVPRVLLTAYADTQLAVDALNRAGVAQFMTKPVEGRNMEAVVTRLLAEGLAGRQRKAAFERSMGALKRAGPGNP